MAYKFTVVDNPQPKQLSSNSPRTRHSHYRSICPNCGGAFEWVGSPQRTYCGLGCCSEAEAVRYARKKLAEYPDMSWPEDIKYAVRIQIAHAISGGYDRAARRLSKDVRAAVIERDGGRCQLCNDSGEDIDHIDGPSADLTNLRLLCKPCHASVTSERLVPLSNPEQAVHSADIWRRIRLPSPERPSDTADWQASRSAWISAHRQNFEPL